MGQLTLISCFLFAIIHGEKMLVLSKDFDVYWRDYNGTIPADALLGAPTGIYIAQVLASTCNLIPGTLFPQKHFAATLVQMERVQFRENIKVLCTSNPNAFYWEDVNVQQVNGQMLENCVLGGYEAESSVYIGRVFNEGIWKVGKVLPTTAPYKGLRAWWNNGTAYLPKDFQILKGW